MSLKRSVDEIVARRVDNAVLRLNRLHDAGTSRSKTHRPVRARVEITDRGIEVKSPPVWYHVLVGQRVARRLQLRAVRVYGRKINRGFWNNIRHRTKPVVAWRNVRGRLRPIRVNPAQWLAKHIR